MEPGDVDAVAALTGALGYPVDADEVAHRWAHIREPGGGVILVAVDPDDRPIGWIHVSRMATLEMSDAALIGGLVVDSRRRGERIGAALVTTAEAWARERGARRIVVRSRSTRTRAHRFYERLGYAPVKVSHVFEKPIG
jgi:GNAT superfamily N-acetyltransferase